MNETETALASEEISIPNAELVATSELTVDGKVAIRACFVYNHMIFRLTRLENS